MPKRPVPSRQVRRWPCYDEKTLSPRRSAAIEIVLETIPSPFACRSPCCAACANHAAFASASSHRRGDPNMNQFTHPQRLSMLEKRQLEAEILKEAYETLQKSH